MSVPKDRPQPGPGAPLTAEREQYRRLMAQGLNNHQACLLIGVNPTTGMRWSKGRNMVDHTGKACYYPPIHAEPKVISPRYLSEEERILIGDLLLGSSGRDNPAQRARPEHPAGHSSGPYPCLTCHRKRPAMLSRTRLSQWDHGPFLKQWKSHFDSADPVKMSPNEVKMSPNETA